MKILVLERHHLVSLDQSKLLVLTVNIVGFVVQLLRRRRNVNDRLWKQAKIYRGPELIPMWQYLLKTCWGEHQVKEAIWM